jgi:hypothetical protein
MTSRNGCSTDYLCAPLLEILGSFNSLIGRFGAEQLALGALSSCTSAGFDLKRPIRDKK